MDTHTPHALGSQVGGHAGVMTTEDGSLIIKPALARELEFYEAIQANPALEDLRPFTPRFYGILKLQGQVDASQEEELPEVLRNMKPVEDQKESIVLENLSFPFSKPNILDIKLGTVLYDEDAPQSKVQRMLETARNTTSLETGIRLTGFQVYDNITSKPVNTPKSYGKSIKSSDLEDGIARFFPVGSDSADISPSHGLPRDILLRVLRGVRTEIAVIRETLESAELRMVGGSLLVVYEADWEKAALAIKKYEEALVKSEYEYENEDEEEEEDHDDEEEEAPKLGPPFTVKLIDFAHTRVKPGQGPDEGVLLGVDTLLKLLDARYLELMSSLTSA